MLNRIDVQNDPVNFFDPWGLAAAEIRSYNPTITERIKSKLMTDAYNVIHDPHPNARLNTVMTYTATAVTASTTSSAALWKYGLRYSPYVGTVIGKAAYDYWGTGQPGWFALKDKIQSWAEDFKKWWKERCENS